MGFKSSVKKGFFSGLNPLRWAGYDQISSSAKTIKNLVDSAIDQSSKNIVYRETFEECLQRFKLTEADIKRRMKTSLIIVLFCLCTSLAIIGYIIYLFFQGFPLSAFVCIVLVCVLWAYAFREHFNYFQMKQRRLGCTFKEWLTFILRMKS